MTAILIAIHTASLAGLAVYGLLGFLTLGLFLRHRRSNSSLPPMADRDLPTVTIQLPIYNEREVVRRVIDAVAVLDYPIDRFEIQVLDDSNDETTALAAEYVSRYKDKGLNIDLHHRGNRHGYKAGALQESFATSHGEFIAIFDADFIPPPDFLRRLIPYFHADPHLGVVQARWGHLNVFDSNLTSAQAIALDKHFVVEQLVRHHAKYFPKFNGSAGIWRRSCIAETGGWQVDTVCEDLCLSTRAILAGWQFHYANDFVVPAELPSTILAYKVQQARWAMGATQCLVKYSGQIWRAEQQTVMARIYALLSMSAYTTHALFLVLLLIQLPLLLTGSYPPSWLLGLSIAGLGQPVLFVLAQQDIYGDWFSRLRHLPTLFFIAIGLAPSNTWAVIQGLSHREFTFARTPKGPMKSYRLTPGRMLFVEALLFAYSVLTLAIAIDRGFSGPIFLLISACLGFGHIIFHGLREMRLLN